MRCILSHICIFSRSVTRRPLSSFILKLNRLTTLMASAEPAMSSSHGSTARTASVHTRPAPACARQTSMTFFSTYASTGGAIPASTVASIESRNALLLTAHCSRKSLPMDAIRVRNDMMISLLNDG